MIVNTANSLFMYYLSMPYTANNIKISYIKRMTKHCHARGRTCPSRDRPSSGNYLSITRQVLHSRQYAIQSIVP